MIVVDHEPHDWFLLQDHDGLVLDVNCATCLVSLSALLRLTTDETARVAAGGRSAVIDLVQSIQRDPATFAHRSGGAPLEQSACAAILRWRAAQSIA